MKRCKNDEHTIVIERINKKKLTSTQRYDKIEKRFKKLIEKYPLLKMLYENEKIELTTILELSYSFGHEEGYDEGYTDGYEVGHKDGEDCV